MKRDQAINYDSKRATFRLQFAQRRCKTMGKIRLIAQSNFDRFHYERFQVYWIKYRARQKHTICALHNLNRS